MTENQKLKNLLKKLFEDKEYKSTIFDGEFADEVDVYDFYYTMRVGAVVGEGSNAVGDIQVTISSITVNGEDFYPNWVLDNYSNNTWYMSDLNDLIWKEHFDLIPFSVYLTIYGYDEEMI
jgi:hypothetical protein